MPGRAHQRERGVHIAAQHRLGRLHHAAGCQARSQGGAWAGIEVRVAVEKHGLASSAGRRRLAQRIHGGDVGGGVRPQQLPVTRRPRAEPARRCQQPLREQSAEDGVDAARLLKKTLRHGQVSQLGRRVRRHALIVDEAHAAGRVPQHGAVGDVAAGGRNRGDGGAAGSAGAMGVRRNRHHRRRRRHQQRRRDSCFGRGWRLDTNSHLALLRNRSKRQRPVGATLRAAAGQRRRQAAEGDGRELRVQSEARLAGAGQLGVVHGDGAREQLGERADVCEQGVRER